MNSDRGTEKRSAGRVGLSTPAPLLRPHCGGGDEKLTLIVRGGRWGTYEERAAALRRSKWMVCACAR